MSTLSATQESTRYFLDASHSTVEFTVRHLMISKVRGRFAAFQGSIDLAPGNDLPHAVDVSIDVASIDTREAQRDAHLKSADFFDAEKYQAITFRSTAVEGTAEAFRLRGELTIHGVTKEAELTGSFEGRAADPWGGRRIGYAAHVTINRKDFGLTWNQALETGGVMVSDEVRIELDIQAVQQK
jgi:polyisoprenoid-binding protein YceI